MRAANRKEQENLKLENLVCASARFPIGEIGVACSEKGLREVLIRKTQTSPSSGRRVRSNESGAPVRTSNGNSAGKFKGAAMARRALEEIAEFLDGNRRDFTVPLDLHGTTFQLQVWNALRRIPYGETRSYADIARAVGRPKAARAVGMANHWNPLAIVVPCHRVVASDGSLGGYAGGLDKKTRLLRLEASQGASTNASS
jgi:methylated-DNA-[protein]-cysteine S-methyltransferase